MMENNIRFRQIGRLENLPDPVLEEMEITLEETREQRRADAGAGAELRQPRGDHRRRRGPSPRRSRRGQLDPRDIRRSDDRPSTSTRPACPTRTCSIRTAGEMRISNYLLWQISYAELYVSQVLWPDFGVARAARGDRVVLPRRATGRFGALDHTNTTNARIADVWPFGGKTGMLQCEYPFPFNLPYGAVRPAQGMEKALSQSSDVRAPDAGLGLGLCSGCDHFIERQDRPARGGGLMALLLIALPAADDRTGARSSPPNTCSRTASRRHRLDRPGHPRVPHPVPLVRTLRRTPRWPSSSCSSCCSPPSAAPGATDAGGHRPHGRAPCWPRCTSAAWLVPDGVAGEDATAPAAAGRPAPLAILMILLVVKFTDIGALLGGRASGGTS